MDQNQLGNTDIFISPIGFGAFKIGRNEGTKYEADYDLPGDTEVEELLNQVLDLGINYIDTAPAYGTSEKRIGKAISSRRDEYIISTKVGERFIDGKSSYNYTPDAVKIGVDRSRYCLDTDVLDIVFIHSDGNDCDIMDSSGAVETLKDLKRAGVIRAIGLSGKTIEGAEKAMEWADVLMVEYHCEDTSHEAVMKLAKENGVGIIVKKGLASGKLQPSEAIPFVLKNQSVTSLVIGGLDIEHFKHNIQLAKLLE